MARDATNTRRCWPRRRYLRLRAVLSDSALRGAEFGTQLQTMFDHDRQQSDTVTLEKWEHQPLGPRVKELFARLWEYWL